MSSISVDLPEPDTPVTATNRPSGISTSRLRRLCSRAPSMRIDRGAVRADGASSGVGIFSSPLRYCPVIDAGLRMISSTVPSAITSPPCFPAPGPEIDQVVRRAHRLLVVLDDDHRVAEVAQLLERREQPRVVALVQPDRRLVENVEHADEPRPDLRRQPNALRLAARERFGRAAEREVVEPDVDEEAQTLAHFLEDRAGDLGIEARRAVRARTGTPSKNAERLGDRHLDDVADALRSST